VIDLHEIRQDVFTSGLNSPAYMRLTHIPTGTVVTGTGHVQFRLRSQLLEELSRRVLTLTVNP